ncbi:hypothetical protein FCR2A7T_23400 [Flavobacterium cauense R2A-7]|nr:hypothetical protein FCR2A7T_23400 [Flavobacterium cauense R2A-7]
MEMKGWVFKSFKFSNQSKKQPYLLNVFRGHEVRLPKFNLN